MPQFDSRESERLWNTLGQINAQLGDLADRVDTQHHGLERRLRRLEKRDRMVTRVTRRKDVRAAVVAAIVALSTSLAAYFETRAAALRAAEIRSEIPTIDTPPRARHTGP